MKVITYTLIAENPVYNETEQDVFARNSQNATLLTTSFITSGRLGTWKNLEGKGKKALHLSCEEWQCEPDDTCCLLCCHFRCLPVTSYVHVRTSLGGGGKEKKACATMTQNTPHTRLVDNNSIAWQSKQQLVFADHILMRVRNPSNHTDDENYYAMADRGIDVTPHEGWWTHHQNPKLLYWLYEGQTEKVFCRSHKKKLDLQIQRAWILGSNQGWWILLGSMDYNTLTCMRCSFHCKRDAWLLVSLHLP